MKRPLQLRIGLHTGPVFVYDDRISRKLSFTGVHVTRTARIEPITEAGKVYASEEFAAMVELNARVRLIHEGRLAVETGPTFECRFVRECALAKGYAGRHRIYEVCPVEQSSVIEELAKAAHECWLDDELRAGASLGDKPSLCSWDKLPEHFRESNRAQVTHIPAKLRLLGFELGMCYGMHPSKIELGQTQLDQLAEAEHGRWYDDLRAKGWTRGPNKDKMEHPLLVPWRELAPEVQKKNRDIARNVPLLIEKAGWRVRKLTDVQ